jgi:hypothetical protein
MVSVSGYLIGSQEAGKMPLPPKAELEWWYQFYFATDRGRAGLRQIPQGVLEADLAARFTEMALRRCDLRPQCGGIRQPRTTFAIVIHNYRWRLALADGEPRYADFDQRLAEFPVIGVPTITMEGRRERRAPHP